MKIVRISFFALSLATLISACESNKKNALVYDNTVDNNIPWMHGVPANVISLPNAHSGRYVCKLNASAPYSLAFNATFNQISVHKINKVTYTAFLNRDNSQIDTKLIIEIRDKEDKLLNWSGKDVQGDIKKDHNWEQVSFSLDVNKNNWNNPENVLRVYTLSSTGTDVLADDFQVTIETE